MFVNEPQVRREVGGRADILLCLINMPLTMLELLHNYWPLESGQVRRVEMKSS